jgi:hypothetical protein
MTTPAAKCERDPKLKQWTVHCDVVLPGEQRLTPRTVADAVGDCEKRLAALRRATELVAELKPLLVAAPELRTVLVAELSGKAAATPVPGRAESERVRTPTEWEREDDPEVPVADRVIAYFARSGNSPARASDLTGVLGASLSAVRQALVKGEGRRFERTGRGLYRAKR